MRRHSALGTRPWLGGGVRRPRSRGRGLHAVPATGHPAGVHGRVRRGAPDGPPRIVDLGTPFGEAQDAIRASLAGLQQEAGTMDHVAEMIVAGVGAGKVLQEAV